MLSAAGAIQVLKNLPGDLTDLNLSHNSDIGAEVAQVIQRVVLENFEIHLQTLELESCRIGDQGTERICKGLLSGCGLKFLNVSNNGITDIGAEHLALCLAEQPSLLILFVHWNHFGPHGGKCFGQAL